MTPGSNILSEALDVIGRQEFLYYPFYARETGATGLDVSEYEPPQEMTGSVQPVPRNLYQFYGLDLQKNFFTFFIENDAMDISRDVGGDKFVFNGKTFNAVSKTDWFAIDGWTSILVVQVSNAR